MEFNETNDWFVFKFTRADYRQLGSNRINTFLAELRKSIPASDRHYYAKNCEWQIAQSHREIFNRLYQKNLMPGYQRMLKL